MSTALLRLRHSTLVSDWCSLRTISWNLHNCSIVRRSQQLHSSPGSVMWLFKCVDWCCWGRPLTAELCELPLQARHLFSHTKLHMDMLDVNLFNSPSAGSVACCRPGYSLWFVKLPSPQSPLAPLNPDMFLQLRRISPVNVCILPGNPSNPLLIGRPSPLDP